ncbi:hypothetical protein BX070DRAFT_225184, partial [Coemansia spiralis]
VFSLDDVIGYTGVDLREESEIILGSSLQQQSVYRRPRDEGVSEDEGPMVSTRIIDGVEVARDRSLETGFANTEILEALVSRACKHSHIKSVSADAIPYLSLALQERLRSFIELVSAAAYHRTRTQTLPPPPLDPNTRLPLYKITPHLDIKKQLIVLERMDKMREENRKRLLIDREQNNSMESQMQDDDSDGIQARNPADERRKPAISAGTGSFVSEGASEASAGFSNAVSGTASTMGDGSGNQPLQPVMTSADGSSSTQKNANVAKRGRKREDSASELPTYTNKNMPDDIRNKISNQTALRAAGGVRKSWMDASSADWMGDATTTKTTTMRPGDNTKSSLQHESSEASDGTVVLPGGDSSRAGNVIPAYSSGAAPAKRTASIGSVAGNASGRASSIDLTGNVRTFQGHRRNRSSTSNASEFDGVAVLSPAADGTMTPGLHSTTSLRPPPALLSHRSTSLAAPLLVTVRDCLFSLERERLGSARVGRGGGDRVLIQAYNKYVHD